MAGQGGHDQQLGVSRARLNAGQVALEMKDTAERLFPDTFLLHTNGPTIDLCRVEPEGRFAISSRQAFKNPKGGDGALGPAGACERVGTVGQRRLTPFGGRPQRGDQRMVPFIGMIKHLRLAIAFVQCSKFYHELPKTRK